MTQAFDAAYLRRRLQSSRTAAFDATDVCARSAHIRIAAAYELQLRDAEVVTETVLRATSGQSGASSSPKRDFIPTE